MSKVVFSVALLAMACFACVLMSVDSRSYDRWQEMSDLEHTFMRECTRHQPYFTCTENVHEMRQLGVAP